jgi:hypothetical protein
VAKDGLTPDELLAGLFEETPEPAKAEPISILDIDKLITEVVAVQMTPTAPKKPVPPNYMPQHVAKVIESKPLKPKPKAAKTKYEKPSDVIADALDVLSDAKQAVGKKPGPNEPTTQKATGIFALQTASTFTVPPFKLVRTETHLNTLALKGMAVKNKVFVRPCPPKPMHGFVDSRLIDVYDEEPGLDGTLPLFSSRLTVKAILEEARQADPDSELIIMQPIPASCNMILAPGMLTIGPGTDGATAGHGSVSIPLAGSLAVHAGLLKAAKIDTTDPETAAPYFEILHDEATKQVWWVQLRGGPTPPKANDFIPAKMTVEHVVEAEGDLLEWGAKVKTFKPGTAVNHAGGNPLSHYFVHCSLHNVPILTTRVPVVGEVLEPIPVEPYDADAFLDGFHEAYTLPMTTQDAKELAATMLLGCHHSSAMRGPGTRWIGMAVALMLRLGGAASIGEWRHKNKALGSDRSKVYNDCFKDAFAMRARLPMALKSFGCGDWGSGYGGPAWADCTAALFDLDDAVVTLHKADTGAAKETAIVQAIDAFNVVVNKAHNGGWWMNKFISQSVFDALASGDLQQIPRAGLGLWAIHRKAKKKKAIESYGKWMELSPLGRNAEAMETVATFRAKGKTEAMKVMAKHNAGGVVNDVADAAEAAMPIVEPGPITSVTAAQVKIDKSMSEGAGLKGKLHFQIAHNQTPNYTVGHAWSTNMELVKALTNGIHTMPTHNSLSGSDTQYIVLAVEAEGENFKFLLPDGTHLATITPKCVLTLADGSLVMIASK